MASGDFACDCRSSRIGCDCQTPRIASVRRCSLENPCISIRKLVQLMEDPISMDLYDRHLIILNDFIAASKCSFWVRDLPYIMRLLELLMQRINIVCLYRKPLLTLLSICATPPLLTRTSEALTYDRDLQEYFSFLGYLLICIHDHELQQLVLRAIKKLICRQATAFICSVTLKTRYTAVEKSRLPNIISQLLELVDDKLYVKLLEISLILVHISDIVCQKMISENAVNILLCRLIPSWMPSEKHVPLPNPDENSTIENFEMTAKILWSLLEAVKKAPDLFKKNAKGPNGQATSTIMFVLKLLVKKGKSCELNRNHMMSILLQCFDLFPHMPLAKTGLATDLAVISGATEIGTGGTWAAQVRFGTTENDYEFKKMSLLALCYCAKHPSVTMKVLKPKRVIPALLKIITPELKTNWHPQQHNKLMSLTLHTLQVFVPQLPNEFTYYNGPGRILSLIEYFYVDSFDLENLKNSLKLLYLISSVKNEDLLNNLLVNEAPAIIRSICENFLTRPILTLAIQQCLTYGFSILEKLCQCKVACEPSAVHTCMAFLKRAVNPKEEDPVYDPNFLICAINYIWEGVVWNENNLKLFISMGGVFTFLDIIQKSNFCVKLVALGALVDMCFDGTCVPHLLTWRKNGQKLLPMLLELFREENFRIGAKSTPTGAIADIEIPLMGHQQWYETFYENKDPNSSPATVDLLGSCRPKIYALIQLLTNRHEMRADIVNEQYRLYDMEGLTTLDKMTLLLAENFLALKLGEAWVELSKDIEKIGVRPLAVDGELIGFLTKRFRKWTVDLKRVQDSLLTKQSEKDYSEEKLLYNALKESKLCESLKALRDLDYIARTSERMFRLITKMRKSSKLEQSVPFVGSANHHNTFLYNIKVNPVYNQEISIQSDIIVDPNEEQFHLDLVSLATDEESLHSEGSKASKESIAGESEP